jgi:hypothetical protein
LSVNGKPDSTVIRPAFRSYSLQLSYRGWCPNRSFNEEVISITKYLGSEGLWCQFPWTPITFSVALCCDTPCGWSLFVFFFFFFLVKWSTISQTSPQCHVVEVWMTKLHTQCWNCTQSVVPSHHTFIRFVVPGEKVI